MHTPLHSFPIDMRDPDFRRGEIFDVLSVWVSRVFRLSSALWVDCMRLPSSSMTWRAFLIS